MQCEVFVVGDDELAGATRVIVERPGKPPLLVLTESGAACWRFVGAWKAQHGPDAELLHLHAV